MPNIQGNIANPPTASQSGTTTTFLQGKAGELLDAKLKGDYFSASYYNRQFCATTAAAGVAIPIQSSTSALTFTLYNPIGSSIVTELLRINIGFLALGFVVGTFGLGYKSGLNSLTIPLATTAGNIVPTAIGGNGAAQTQFFTAATISAAATGFLWLPGQLSATSGVLPQLTWDLNGCVVLTPGSFVTLVCSAAQTGSEVVSCWFNEWPV